MTERDKIRLESLKRRLDEYYEAESAILKGQSYSLGSMQLTRASLAAVQSKIADLETQISQLESRGTTKRRSVRVIPH